MSWYYIDTRRKYYIVLLAHFYLMFYGLVWYIYLFISVVFRLTITNNNIHYTS